MIALNIGNTWVWERPFSAENNLMEAIGFCLYQKQKIMQLSNMWLKNTMQKLYIWSTDCRAGFWSSSPSLPPSVCVQRWFCVQYFLLIAQGPSSSSQFYLPQFIHGFKFWCLRLRLLSLRYDSEQHCCYGLCIAFLTNWPSCDLHCLASLAI